MKKLFVKYCGFTRKRDVDYAVDLGVDALGFIFYEKSKRYVSPEQVCRITADVPAHVLKVGVFVGETPETIHCVAKSAGITHLQLFAAEMENGGTYELPVIPAYRVSDAQSIPGTVPYNRILLDAYSPDEAGGSGRTFNWELIESVKQRSDVIVAGGIGTENLRHLLQTVSPYGIDVSSGIEEAKGMKSAKKMKELMSIVEETE